MNLPTRIFIIILALVGCVLTAVVGSLGAQLYGAVGFVVCVSLALIMILVIAKLHLDNTEE